MGPAVPDHPQFEQLLARLKEMGADVSISSLRIKPLYPQAFSEIARGTGTVALAPEAGSERLRRVIKKGITEEDILRAMESVADQGIKRLKLYFMIGLPTETDDDIGAIADLTVKCKAVLERRHGSTRVTLSVASFVPKAGTPFEWMPMEHLAVLNHRLDLLKGLLEPKGVRVGAESHAWSEVQAVLARGDAKLSAVLASMGDVSLPSWHRALKEHDINADEYAHRTLETESELPWGMIDSGRGAYHLKRELELALRPSQDVNDDIANVRAGTARPD